MRSVIRGFVSQFPPVMHKSLTDAFLLVADIAAHREREKSIKFCATTPLTGADLATALARSLHSSPQRQASAEAEQVNSLANTSISGVP